MKMGGDPPNPLCFWFTCSVQLCLLKKKKHRLTISVEFVCCVHIAALEIFFFACFVVFFLWVILSVLWFFICGLRTPSPP